jgi:hypothetical protein
MQEKLGTLWLHGDCMADFTHGSKTQFIAETIPVISLCRSLEP